jgi:hypothetical protein
MRSARAGENGNSIAQSIGLIKIGELLRDKYGAIEGPMPEHLTTLLEQLEPKGRFTLSANSAFKPTCPRCKTTMRKVVHALGLGGHPSLGGYACPECRYIAGGSMNEAIRESIRL